MTRYTYNTQTFRLLRQRSEKYIRTHLNGMITYAYDPGSNKQDDAFNYDLVGNILNILSSKTACGIGGTNQLNRQFSYDPLYRLTSATGRENVPGSSYPFPGWEDFTRSTDPNTTTAYTRNYKYDKLGNIQQLQHIGSTNFTRSFNYAANTNKLDELNIGANSYNYTYDACGNQLTSNTERKFEWDASNKLLCFRNQAGSSEPSVIAQYLYDSAGNRTKKIVRKQGGIFEIRTYIDGVFEFFTDETEEQNTIHIMDDTSRIATVRLGYNFDDTTPSIKYVLENNIGSSMLLLDDAGAPVNAQEYYPFGETSFGSYAKKRYQYTGKERDEESGLYYYGARYYAAWTCKFISIDPLAAKYPSLSGYLYAYNNPIMMNDPTGMEGEKGGENTDNIGGSLRTMEFNIGRDGADVGGIETADYKESIHGNDDVKLELLSGDEKKNIPQSEIKTKEDWANFDVENETIQMDDFVVEDDKPLELINNPSIKNKNSNNSFVKFLKSAWNFVVNAVEDVIDALTFTITALPASIANGSRYAYKDLTTGYPVLSDEEKFKPYGFSFKNGFKQETPYYGTENRATPKDGARIIKGVTNIIIPPFISPIPFWVKTPVSISVGTVVPAHIKDKK